MSCSNCAKSAAEAMRNQTGVPVSGSGEPARCSRCGQWLPDGGAHVCPSGMEDGSFFAEWTIACRNEKQIAHLPVVRRDRARSTGHREIVEWLEAEGSHELADIADMGGIAAFRRYLLDTDGWDAVHVVAENAHGLPPSQVVDDIERNPGAGPERGSSAFEDRCRAVMIGMALGDALGYRVEFNKKDKLLNEYGLWGIHTPPERGGTMLYTDDTQMAVALARGLVDATNNGADWHDEVRDRFIEWLRDPENNRAPGNTCLGACRALAAGRAWKESGKNNSKGCGTVMRVAPVGALCRDMPYERLRAVAAEQSDMTHGHPTARAASIACAHSVALLLKDTPPLETLRQVYKGLKSDPGSREMRRELARVAGLLADNADEYQASEELGSGWVAEEAMSIAMWSFMKSPDDYPAVIRRAVNFAGRNGSCDRDSVGAIAGALAGAWTGMQGIPDKWERKIEHRDWLVDLGTELAKKEVRL